jgi:type II secretory pathway predicted ATPase ExeA
MYETFYGLREEPFRLSPDARLCFPHPSYKKAKAYMQYALQRQEGFVMVTGRPGTGTAPRR